MVLQDVLLRKSLMSLLQGLIEKEIKGTLTLNKGQRNQALFNLPTFGIPAGFYTTTTKKTPPLFEICCKGVLDTFRHWNGSKCMKQDYLMTFSYNKWIRLKAEEKARHSLEKRYWLCNTPFCTPRSISWANIQGG